MITKIDIMLLAMTRRKSCVRKCVNIGAAIMAAIDARPEILPAINVQAHVNVTKIPTSQLVMKKTAMLVETPFPPLNSNHMGNICPSTAHTPIKRWTV